MSLKFLYILLKILGISVLIVPILLKGLNYLTDLSTFTIIVLIIVGWFLLVLGDISEKKYKRKNENGKDNNFN